VKGVVNAIKIAKTNNTPRKIIVGINNDRPEIYNIEAND